MIELSGEKHIISELMNSEWSRYRSFITFPAGSAVMPSRLAHAGFYYSGFNEEAICFCCGLKNDIWTQDESVIDVHARLSPNCRYIQGDDTNNIAIHGQNKLKRDSVSNKGNENSSRLSYFNCEKSFLDNEEDKSVLIEAAKNDETVPYATRLPTNSNENVQFGRQSCHHAQHKETVLTKCSYRNTEVQLYPGIVDDSPRNPDYAMESIRLASFEEWPTDIISSTPSDLAKTGFFYAGSSDCVRCFFCNGGLKDWEYGDKPWVEHAKWFPDCAYVKLCKGKTFVNICSAGINSDLTENDEAQLQQGHENIPEDWLIEGINSPAAKLILAKGYSQQDIEKAVMFVRQTYGHGEVKVQYIMEYLQETNAKASTTTEEHGSFCRMSKDSEVHLVSDNAKCDPENALLSENTGKNRNILGKNTSEKENLLEENRKLKDLMTCKICMDSEACVAFLPCGHLSSCLECSKSLRKCAVCRAVVLGTVRVYQA